MYGVAIRFALSGSKAPLSKNSLLFYNSALGSLVLGLFLLAFRRDELQR